VAVLEGTVEAAEYKALTSRPNAFLRDELDDTVRVLTTIDVRLAGLVDALPRIPIPKPPQHRGGPSTDFLSIDARPSLVAEIVQQLLTAEAEAVSADGESTPEASWRAALVDRWTRYQRWLER
jgi:hypothetical protein